jgi:glucose/arabinose dehydrogenase
LLLTGLGGGHLMHVEVDGPNIVGVNYLLTGTRFRNVKQAPDGRLYLLTDEPDGRILRIDRREDENRSLR